MNNANLVDRRSSVANADTVEMHFQVVNVLPSMLWVRMQKCKEFDIITWNMLITLDAKIKNHIRVNWLVCLRMVTADSVHVSHGFSMVSAS